MAVSPVLLTLKQDLFSINKLIESSSTLSPNSESNINSWLFPTKPFQFVNNFLKSKDLSKLSYSNILELLIDRLYFIIQLANKSIEAVINIGQKNVIRPKQLSLGVSVEVFWRNVNKLVGMKLKNSSKPVQTQHGQILETKQCQTDLEGLDHCDSCSSAITCMKNLIQSFEKVDKSVFFEKQKIQFQIMDITQFGTMLKVTGTLENSLNSILKQCLETSKQNKKLKEERERLEAEVRSKLRNLDLLEREVNALKEKCDNNKKLLSKLSEENEQLNTYKRASEVKLKSMEIVIKNFQNFVLDSKSKMENVIKEKRKSYLHLEKMNSKLTSLAEKQSEIIERLGKMDKSLSTNLQFLKETNNCLTSKLAERFEFNNVSENIENIERLTGKLDSAFLMIAEEESKIKERLNEVHKNLKENFGGVFDKLKLVQEKLQGFLLAKNALEPSCPKPESSCFKVKGNPVEDMKRQMEENQKKIECLVEDNEKLRGILEKLQKIPALAM